METSLFSQYIDKYFGLVIGIITEKFNGENKKPTMLHKTMLTEEYSADLTWGSTDLNNSIVAADVVSLDSSLPLKRRPSLSNASGKLPKLGVKFRKGENDITGINIMIARGVDEQSVAAKIFDDAPRAIESVDVRKEIMFEEGLSTGQTLVDEENNTGTGVRVTFGFKDDNIIKVSNAWGTAKATPISDLHAMFDKADEVGDTINHVYLSRKYFDYIRKSDEGKLLGATFAGQVITDKTVIPMPSRSNFLNALRDEFGAIFHIVEASFRIENPDGSHKTVKPWKEDAVVGTPEENVGRLVYGTLAEETNPVKQVDYQKSGSHILVSKYSKTDPLEEFTTAQALVLPVIDGASHIYKVEASK